MGSKWNKTTIQKEALKYSSRSAFRKGASRCVKQAKKLGIYEDVCSHIPSKHAVWTRELLLQEALKYTTRGDFQLQASSAYVLCRTRGILDEACEHMTTKIIDWTDGMLIDIALQYRTRGEFQKANSAAYAAARRLGVLDVACEHMEISRKNWTNDELSAEALKYKYRIDFQYYSKGAYISACRRGMLLEICSHMDYKDGATRLSNPMYMYFIKITTFNHSVPVVWKIGITRFKDINRRFAREYSKFETKIEVIKTWYFNTGYDAAEAEKNVISGYKNYSYKGISPLRETKTTEMFTDDILAMEGN